ncbi:MAG: preprotein translocase subunit YajC [Rhodoglobus sp.]
MDPLTIGMLAVLAVLVFFMFRNSRKRKSQQEELRSAIVPGKQVMTNFGLFGTLKSVDEVSNEAELEIAKGVVVKVHRQTIAKVVEPVEAVAGAPRSVEEAMAIANREEQERENKAAKGVELNKDTAIPLGEPAYGERVDDAAKKPVRRTAKKAND